jgi:hypothetical protein
MFDVSTIAWTIHSFPRRRSMDKEQALKGTKDRQLVGLETTFDWGLTWAGEIAIIPTLLR